MPSTYSHLSRIHTSSLTHLPRLHISSLAHLFTPRRAPNILFRTPLHRSPQLFTPQGFFIVFNDIPPWFVWGYHIAFHSYSFRAFMRNEFETIGAFHNSTFKDGKAVLDFYGMQVLFGLG